jgi:cysteine desulfurase/selenocysteine lyase
MTVHLPAGRDRRSGIVIASSPGTPLQVLYDRLLSHGVRCSLRGSGLRFAPHYFAADSDLHRAADTLRDPRLTPARWCP